MRFIWKNFVLLFRIKREVPVHFTCSSFEFNSNSTCPGWEWSSPPCWWVLTPRTDIILSLLLAVTMCWIWSKLPSLTYPRWEGSSSPPYWWVLRQRMGPMVNLVQITQLFSIKQKKTSTYPRWEASSPPCCFQMLPACLVSFPFADSDNNLSDCFAALVSSKMTMVLSLKRNVWVAICVWTRFNRNSHGKTPMRKWKQTPAFFSSLHQRREGHETDRGFEWNVICFGAQSRHEVCHKKFFNCDAFCANESLVESLTCLRVLFLTAHQESKFLVYLKSNSHCE